MICRETIRYQQNTDKYTSWKDVIQQRCWVQYCVNIAVGLVRLPEVSDYYRRNSSMEVS